MVAGEVRDKRPRSLRSSDREEPVVTRAGHMWDPASTLHPGPRAEPKAQPYMEECLPPIFVVCLCLLVDLENKMWNRAQGGRGLSGLWGQATGSGSEPLGAVFGRKQELSSAQVFVLCMKSQ